VDGSKSQVETPVARHPVYLKKLVKKMKGWSSEGNLKRDREFLEWGKGSHAVSVVGEGQGVGD